MLRTWAEHYRWEKDNHIRIVEKDEELVVPENFKEIKGIEYDMKGGK